MSRKPPDVTREQPNHWTSIGQPRQRLKETHFDNLVLPKAHEQSWGLDHSFTFRYSASIADLALMRACQSGDPSECDPKIHEPLHLWQKLTSNPEWAAHLLIHLLDQHHCLYLGSNQTPFSSLKVIFYFESTLPPTEFFLLSHSELTWTRLLPESAAAQVLMFGRKSWVLKLKPSRSEHPIQKPIQPWNNGVEGSSTFTGLITHLTGPHARLNSCIMSAVWPIDLPAHCKHEWGLPTVFHCSTLRLHPTSIIFKY